MGLKDHKIVWFTEGGWQGKVSLDNPNMRNDLSTKYILGAEHYPIFQIPQVLQHFGNNHFDFAIVTLPVPLGSKAIFPLLDEIILLLFTSNAEVS